MPYPSIVGAAALWFGFVGPAVPFPAMALRTYLLTGRFDPKLFEQSFELYFVALLFGGLAAAVVGLLYGLYLVVIDRFRPALLHAAQTKARFAKSIVLPLVFTAVLGTLGSLIQILATVALLPPVPGMRLAGFQPLGDPVAFAAPTLFCAIPFTFWALRQLPRQIGLLAGGADGEVRQP